MKNRLIAGYLFVFLVIAGCQLVLAKELVVTSFEEEKDLAKFEASEGITLERSTEHATEGKYSLRVTFSSKAPVEWLNISLKYPNYPFKDFSSYEYLEMEVYHEDAPNAPNFATVGFLDSQGNSRPGWVPVTAYPKKIERAKIPVYLGVGQLSEKNKFSFSDVVQITMTTQRPNKDFTVYFDNIRLVSAQPLIIEKEELPSISPPSLKDIAYFRSLSVLWLGEGEIKDLIPKYSTLKVLSQNRVNFRIGTQVSLEELKAYDLVVFDNFPKDKLTLQQLEYIREFYNKGGAVVMFGGRNSFTGTNLVPGYQNTPIEDILPVRLIKPGMEKGYGYYINLDIVKPDHPIVEGIPWLKSISYDIKDGIAEDPDGYTKGIKPKEGAEVLVSETGSKVPIIVSGNRSLIFNLEPRLINYYFPYNFWERFIVQSFCYLTRDKKTDKVILAKIDLSSPLLLDSKVIDGRFYPVNLGSTLKTVKAEVGTLDIKETLNFKIEPKEVKEVKFSLSTPPLKRGIYTISAKIESPDNDSLSKEFSAESTFSVKNILPTVIFCKDEEMYLDVMVKNNNSETKNLRLEVWLENEKEKVKELVKKDITIGVREETFLKYKFRPYISQGKYRLISYLYSGDKLLSEVSDEIRIVEKNIPFLDRDIDLRVRMEALSEKGGLSSDKLFALEELGLRRSDEFSMEMVPGNLITETWGHFTYTWQDYIDDLHKLYQNKVPFVHAGFNFWATRDKYETLVERLNRQIKLACDIGKEYFVGLRMSESEAIIHGFVLFQEKETDSEKVDAFSEFIRKFVKDIGLPEDKLLFLDASHPVPYEWLFSSGADVVGQAFLPIVPVELTQSALRGMARSFNKSWEWEITRWPLAALSEESILIPFDPKTGRPTSTNQQVPTWFFGLPWAGHEGFAGDVHKMYISAYYNGARSINAFSEDLGETPKEAINKFFDFIRDNRRGEHIVAPIGVVKGKGSKWLIPWVESSGYGTGKAESLDYLYLNIFFPGFSEDGAKAKFWWTGTPYGAVDIIYPEMKLEDLKKYNVLIFLGPNQMDSVRKDFLNDLIAYVQDGGIVLLSVDQLRNTLGKIEGEKLRNFLGLKIDDNYPFPPKKKITEYIKVIDETPFGLEKTMHSISSESVRIYDVDAKAAKIVAKDKKDNPILLCNRWGKGYVFLFTTPTISVIPSEGKSPFVSDVIEKVCRYKPLPINISPRREGIEFLISRTGDKEATVFIMNHNENDWSGDIVVNLNVSGLSSKIGENIEAKIVTGYQVKRITPEIKIEGDNLIIKGITLLGDSQDFCSYREASFAYIRVKGE